MQVFGETLLFLVSAISLSDSQSYQTCSYFASPMLLEATTTPQPIQVPNNYEQIYRRNQNCQWKIKARNEDHVIKLIVKSYQMEGRDIHKNCGTDYVNIFDVKDGANIFKRRFCGESEEGLTILSTESAMNIQFISDARFQFRGFQGTFESYAKKESNGKASMGLLLGVVNVIVVFFIIVCVVIAVYRIRKRKESERNLAEMIGRTGTHVGNSSSPRTASPPAYSTDLSPFVRMENAPAVESRQHTASSFDHTTRSHTPPPAYEEIDQATQVERRDMPPPSYDTAVRESSHIESSADANNLL